MRGSKVASALYQIELVNFGAKYLIRLVIAWHVTLMSIMWEIKIVIVIHDPCGVYTRESKIISKITNSDY